MSAGFPKTKTSMTLRELSFSLLCKIVLILDRFPCVLPFSQMYPLCCIDIRNFLNQFYFFSDDHFQHPNKIDETLRKVRNPLTRARAHTHVHTHARVHYTNKHW